MYNKFDFEEDELKTNLTAGGQLAIFLCFTGLGLILATIVGVLIITLGSGKGFGGLLNAVEMPQNVGTLRLIQIMSTATIFFIPTFLFTIVVARNPLSYLGINKGMDTKQLLLVAMVVFLGIVLSGSLTTLNEQIPVSKKLELKFKKMEKEYEAEITRLVKITTVNEYLLSLFIIALLPAFLEELFFRAGLQKVLIKLFNNAWVGIIVTGILFSLVHFSFYGFLSRAALGIILGFLYHRSKSIWPNVLAHFLNNALAVTELYYLAESKSSIENNFDDKFPIWWGILSMVALYFVLSNFQKHSAENISGLEKS